uniref:Polynucleotide kinase n=1 Tax=viral metagenome TaxID=1070528 RepID=A0A6C0LZY6_9ZZZZ
MAWHIGDDVITYNLKLHNDASKVAAFDVDGTLIVGDPFAREWKPRHNANDAIERLLSGGYEIVIFSNAGGVESGKITAKYVIDKMTEVIHHYKLEKRCSALFATTKSMFRKPLTGMWRLGCEHVGKTDSFFVGDAGGRRRDFSCADRDFAYNVGIRYFTPEEFFDNAAISVVECKHIDPEDYYPATSEEAADICAFHSRTHEATSKEIVLMVGFQASGKSTFVRRAFPNYTVVSRDRDKSTLSKDMTKTKKSIANGVNVVVDNTNLDLKTRETYYELGLKLGVNVRVFYMDVPFDLCMKFLRYFRMETNTGPYIPDVAMYTARKRFVIPSIDEGCSSIEIVGFLPPVNMREFDMHFPYGKF